MQGALAGATAGVADSGLMEAGALAGLPVALRSTPQLGWLGQGSRKAAMPPSVLDSAATLSARSLGCSFAGVAPDLPRSAALLCFWPADKDQSGIAKPSAGRHV